MLNKTILFLIFVASISCQDKIVGNPEKVMADYIKAVQENDFATIYKLNVITIRQEMFIRSSDEEAIKEAVTANVERNRLEFEAIKPTLSMGTRWGEKYFFLPGASVTVGKAYNLAPVGDDPVNSEYEKAASVLTSVKIVYESPEKAPKHPNGLIKVAQYECTLRKTRQGKNVRIYSHDEKWYFSACVLDELSVEYFAP